MGVTQLTFGCAQAGWAGKRSMHKDISKTINKWQDAVNQVVVEEKGYRCIRPHSDAETMFHQPSIRICPKCNGVFDQ